MFSRKSVTCKAHISFLYWTFKIASFDLGHKLTNISMLAFVFLVFSIISGKMKASWKASMLYSSYNHCPCARAAHVGESWLRTCLLMLQNSRSLMFILRVKNLYCQLNITTGKIQDRKIKENTLQYKRATQQYKRACVSPSVPHKIAKWLQRVSAPG